MKTLQIVLLVLLISACTKDDPVALTGIWRGSIENEDHSSVYISANIVQMYKTVQGNFMIEMIDSLYKKYYAMFDIQNGSIYGSDVAIYGSNFSQVYSLVGQVEMDFTRIDGTYTIKDIKDYILSVRNFYIEKEEE